MFFAKLGWIQRTIRKLLVFIDLTFFTATDLNNLTGVLWDSSDFRFIWRIGCRLFRPQALSAPVFSGLFGPNFRLIRPKYQAFSAPFFIWINRCKYVGRNSLKLWNIVYYSHILSLLRINAFGKKISCLLLQVYRRRNEKNRYKSMRRLWK